MGRRLEYEVKTSVRLNMSNPQHVKINDVIQNLSLIHISEPTRPY